jgi:hypothetical protein
MGIENFFVFLPLIFFFILFFLVRFLIAVRRKKGRRVSEGGEAAQQAEAQQEEAQQGNLPDVSPEALWPPNPRRQEGFTYPTSIPIRTILEGEQSKAEGIEQEQAAARRLVSEEASPPPVPRKSGLEAETKKGRGRGLNRLPPLQRAVVWAEILGPPKAES